jgi:hypothetical protein
MIVHSSTSPVMLSFSEFSTQKDADIVQVFECYSIICSDARQLARLSGTYSTIQNIVASTGIVKVVFTSDESIVGTGFSANWNVVSLPAACS